MIRLILLTGFLGAGKTTLMNNILHEFRGEKIGIIVNEFGERDVDGILLEREGLPMRSLSNGSIFCACIKEDFVESLTAMAKEDITHLFIEASGLADPSDMGRILKVTGEAYDYRGSLCVIDPETFIELNELLPALRRQAEYSGAAIINKGDVAAEECIRRASEKLAEINPRCRVFITSYCRLNFKELAESLCPGEKPPEESVNTAETRPKSFVLKARGELPLKALEAFVRELSVAAYRIKGFLPTEAGVMLVNAVGSRVEISPWQGLAPVGELVVISAVGIRMISLITKALGPLEGRLSL